MNDLLEALRKMPLPRVFILTLLLLLVLTVVEQLPWFQSVAEHVFNMEVAK